MIIAYRLSGPIVRQSGCSRLVFLIFTTEGFIYSIPKHGYFYAHATFCPDNLKNSTIGKEG